MSILAVLALLLTVPMAQAQSNDKYFEQGLYIEEGWNLIPYGEGLEIEGLQEEHLLGAYVYRAGSGDYLDILENEYQLDQLVDAYGLIPIWIYSDASYSARVEVDMREVDEALRDAEFVFVEGWNYYVLTPQMNPGYDGMHFNIHQNKYGSVIDDMYMWEDGEWEYIYDEFLEWESYNDDGGFILPVLINYDERFTPTMSEDLSVPAFPY